MAFYRGRILQNPQLSSFGMRPRQELRMYIPLEGFHKDVFIDNPELLEMKGMGAEEEGAAAAKENEIGAGAAAGEPTLKAAKEEGEEEAKEKTAPDHKSSISEGISDDKFAEAKHMYALIQVMEARKAAIAADHQLKSSSVSKEQLEQLKTYPAASFPTTSSSNSALKRELSSSGSSSDLPRDAAPSKKMQKKKDSGLKMTIVD